MTRRDLLITALGGLVPRASDQKTIFIEMAGGPSQVDTFDFEVGPWTPSWMEPVHFGDIIFPAGLMPKLAAMLDRIVLVRGLRAPCAEHRPLVLRGPLLRATAATFGEACHQARSLIEAGANFAHLRLGSWDHHGNLYEQLRPMGRAFDQGVASLIRSAGENIRIVAMGEFGRRPGPLNQNGGRDHYPVHAALLAGAGMPGGVAIESSGQSGVRLFS